MRFQKPASYGLWGEFNPIRETLKRVFKECDRQDKEWEEWEWKWKQRSKEKEPVVKPAVETVSKTDRRIIKRSHSDGIERVWIEGYSRSKYMIHGIANTATINSHGDAILPRGCAMNLPAPLLWQHAKYGGSIGEVCFLQRDEKGIYIRASVFTHEAAQYAWKKVVLGELSGLSCAVEQDQSLHLQAEVGNVKFYDRWRIKEVSIVPTPANKDCFFEIYSPLKKEETKNDEVEQCIIDLTDAGVDEDEAQQICEGIYGDESQ